MTPEPPDPVPRPRPALGRRLLTAVLVAAALVAGLIALGHWTRADLDRRDYYAVPFADIDCPAPPGRDRAAFLAEVQYLGGLPDQFHLLDPTLAARLTEAFAKHPAVEAVEGVDLHPPRSVSVRLRLRELRQEE